jgi:multiple sugar transport system substrate-binding protein
MVEFDRSGRKADARPTAAAATLRGGVSRREFVRGAAAASALFSLAGPLAACGGGGGGDSEAITFLRGPVAEQDVRWQREYAAQFVKEHKGAKVSVNFFDWGTMEADLAAAFSQSQPPDVVYLTTRIWPKYADAGALVDLTDRVKDPAFKETYDAIPQSLWDSVTRDGKIWAIPTDGALFPLFVNRTLLQRAGALDGWDESYEAMFEAAQRIRSGDTYGFTISQSYAEQAYNDLAAYLHNAGAKLIAPDGRSSGLDVPGAADAMDLLRRMHTEGLAPRPGLYDLEGKTALYRAGRVGIAHANPALFLDLAEQKPDFEWDVAMVPPGSAGQTVSGDFGYVGISTASPAQDLAWEYVKYFSSREVVADLMTKLKGTLQAVRTDVIDDLPFPKGGPVYRVQTDFLEKVEAYSTGPEQAELLRSLSTQYEQLIRGQKSGEQMVADAAAAGTELLQQGA